MKNKFVKPQLTVEELSHALFDANLKLQKANEELMSQEKKQKEFYANISHDLRAPMTAIGNAVEYLLSNDSLSSDELHDTLTMMQKRTEYMEHLINDIFLLSSLDSSLSKVHKEPVDISFFLEDYFYMCEADAKYENAYLHLDIPEDLNYTMSLDPFLMHRVLDNLFSNALKYSKSKCKPDITLGAYTDAENLVIYVKDCGIGIAKKHIEKIFDRSYVVKYARTPDCSGSGFGLSIVKAIIKHHGGTVRCESEFNIGSCFIMTFPVV